MYDILVYDEDLGSFVPYRGPDGRTVSRGSWNDAHDVMNTLAIASPDKVYQVQFRTIRRPRRKRGY